MQRYLVVAASCLMVMGWGCGSDRPTSFQELIFERWVAASERTTFREITFQKGSSTLEGTFSAQVVTGQDEETQEPIIATESGTIAISGSVIAITRPGSSQPVRFTWSVDEGVLTFQGGGFGTETYQRG